MAIDNKDIARAAVLMATSCDRNEEIGIKEQLKEKGIIASAADYGGEFSSSAQKIIERAVVCAKREGIIEARYAEEGAVAGACHEAITQIINKALGMNIGGKIGVARCGENICVAVFFAIGMLHLNEISIGLGHRVI